MQQIRDQVQDDRQMASAILDTVGALVVVLNARGRIVRFNRSCEKTTGYSFAEAEGRDARRVLVIPEEAGRFSAMLKQVRSGRAKNDYEIHCPARNGERRLISWCSTALTGGGGALRFVIATGIDVTERKLLERALLEISGREQRRIGQDLHDGLGQHLTGIAFMSKVLEQRLAETALPEAADAAKIVKLVNQAINTTRELARGLLPVLSTANGLMSALAQWALEVEHVFGIQCVFRCDEPVLIHDDNLATHLYHITQEAVNNAIRHGKAQKIVIALYALNGEGGLTIEDDGLGFPLAPNHHSGMGLHIMSHRAKMIDGSLEVQRGAVRGTRITCLFPTSSENRLHTHGEI